jgi:transcription-repair coupling factor (superfamily II helicase)
MKTLRDTIQPALSDIQAGNKTVEVSELWGAAKALFLFGMSDEARRPVIVVTASEEEAEALAEDMSFFVHTMPGDQAGERKMEIRTFPAWGVLPFEADSPDSRTVGERMRFLYNLISGDPGVFLVPVASLMQKLPPWELFVESIKTITIKTQITPDGLIAALVATGYESLQSRHR